MIIWINFLRSDIEKKDGNYLKKKLKKIQINDELVIRNNHIKQKNKISPPLNCHKYHYMRHPISFVVPKWFERYNRWVFLTTVILRTLPEFNALSTFARVWFDWGFEFIPAPQFHIWKGGPVSQQFVPWSS
jgi:hypothetical protein